MFFKINNTYNILPETFKLQIYQLAKTIILLYPEKSVEKQLNQYLLKTYKASLKLICLTILQNSTFMNNSTGDIIVAFKNPMWNNMAKLITYGTGAIHGSSILKHAFSVDN